MRFLRRAATDRRCRLSIVLLDWRCRESFHALDYLADQSADRSSYEIIWVEYYDHVPEALRRKVETAGPENPPIDTWALLEAPSQAPYHKHWLFNAGLAVAQGRHVAFCDSDALFGPEFVRSILEACEPEPEAVVHLDEVRNIDPSFYPFSPPPLTQVQGYGSINWVDGRCAGLLDQADPLHSRNYGACMVAPRDRLIRIGGADMHDEYLGFICGPYEMTWRLVNAGLKERWLEDQWLYHVWHPGQAGDGNLCGPHDGLQIAARALNLRATGRIEPYVIHPAIQALREGQLCGDGRLKELLDPTDWTRRWQDVSAGATPQHLRLGRRRITLRRIPATDEAGEIEQSRPRPLFGHPMPRGARLKCIRWALGQLGPHLALKRRAARASRPNAPGRRMPEILRRLTAGRRFVARILDYERWRLRQCWLLLAYLRQQRYNRIAIYGEPALADALTMLAGYLDLSVESVTPLLEETSELAGPDVPVILATFLCVQDWRNVLTASGVRDDRIHVLV